MPDAPTFGTQKSRGTFAPQALHKGQEVRNFVKECVMPDVSLTNRVKIKNRQPEDLHHAQYLSHTLHRKKGSSLHILHAEISHTRPRVLDGPHLASNLPQHQTKNFKRKAECWLYLSHTAESWDYLERIDHAAFLSHAHPNSWENADNIQTGIFRAGKKSASRIPNHKQRQCCSKISTGTNIPGEGRRGEENWTAL